MILAHSRDNMGREAGVDIIKQRRQRVMRSEAGTSWSRNWEGFWTYFGFNRKTHWNVLKKEQPWCHFCLKKDTTLRKRLKENKNGSRETRRQATVVGSGEIMVA